jgi:hypothetical protein
MFGIFGHVFGFGTSENDWDKRPGNTNGSIVVHLPDNLCKEEIIELQQHYAEHAYLQTMSQREQLEYFKKKQGF